MPRIFHLAGEFAVLEIGTNGFTQHAQSWTSEFLEMFFWLVLSAE